MKPHVSEDKQLAQLRQFMSVYKLYSQRQPQVGGVQTLINDKSRKLIELPRLRSALKTQHEVSLSLSAIDDLPNEILLKILSFLKHHELCRVSLANRRLYEIASSEDVWGPILQAESNHWDQIYSHRFTEFCKNACVGMTSKQIYLACHPRTESSAKSPYVANSTWSANNLASQLSKLAFPKPAKIIMFGPGLESRPSRVVRNLLNDSHFNQTQRFRVAGMSAGLASGVGSGLSLSLNNTSFDLITLYSNVEVVRERLTAENRLENNRLFLKDGMNRFQIRAEIMTLCKKCDGFVFVVDANKPAEETSLAQGELTALLSDIPSLKPLLVINCSSEGSEARVSPLAVAKALHLGRLNRKWMVQAVTVDTLAGLHDGMGWLLEKC